MGEKAVDNPNVYILHHPTMRIHRVLKSGTLRSYASLSFNSRGDKLACVGGDPDYMMTIWDWASEKIILRSKAFSQDVYNIAFHPEMEGMLTTSGMGHIKFWRMANTFTGLKLQGSVGKFGLSELSDINAFIQLPDGKVLSGTESGILLLWEGGAIKCELGIKGIGTCHQGAVDVVLLEDGEILTGGDDGYVRVWDLEVIDAADLQEPGTTLPSTNANGEVTKVNPRMFELEPLEEILIGKDVKVKAIIKSLGTASEYFIQDALGHIYRLDIKKHAAEKLYHFHAGAISTMEFSPAMARMTTLGTDGSLRLFDYISNKFLGRLRFPVAGTCGQYAPAVLDPMGSTFIAGFADGVVRIIKHSAYTAGQVNFTVIFAFKPHSKPITAITVSPDGRFIVTGSSDNTQFIFRVIPKGESRGDLIVNPGTTYSIQPLGFLALPGAPTSFSWVPLDSDNSARNDLKTRARRKYLVILKEGQVFECTTPDVDDLDTELSFELKPREVGLKEFSFNLTDDIAKAEAISEAAWRALVEEENKNVAEGKPTPGAESNPLLQKDAWKVNFSRKGGLNGGYNALNVLFFDHDHVLLSVETEKGDGELRICNITNPKISRLVCRNPVPITSMRFSSSGNYLMYGTKSGALYFQTFIKENFTFPMNWPHGHQLAVLPKITLSSQPSFAAFEPAFQPWVAYIHDSDRGSIRSVGTSFDDAYFCSAGQDGGLFVWRVVEKQQQNSVYNEKDLLATDNKTKAVADITNAATYSIQEAKLKTERDRETQAAEERKKELRKEINNLRDRFNVVLRDWEQSKAFAEDKRWALGMNPGLAEQVKVSLDERIDIVRKSAEWQAERDAIAVEKLRKRFIDEVATERIELQAFKTEHKVATFRTSKLQHSFNKMADHMAAESNAQNAENVPEHQDEAAKVSFANKDSNFLEKSGAETKHIKVCTVVII